MALLTGCNMTMPAPGTKADEKDSWVVVIGGSGNVGQFACQIASLCGYKVVASCSPSKAPVRNFLTTAREYLQNEKILNACGQVAMKAGATATFNNRAAETEQLEQIKAITGGKFGRIFDSSVHGFDLSIKALQTISKEDEKYFSTADDW
jgi:threonine dehydrogenase-like Zn-dependent dehydrogenase